eukprot:scaffold11809_cov128-Cylindrotheca_fusiformis.AAC.20
MPPLEDMLQRYKLIISYDGSRYKGFQRQNSGTENGNGSERSLKRPREESGPRRKKNKSPMTVQESIEDALEHFSGLNRSSLKVRFAGRTDAGVHARGQVVAVSLPRHSNDKLWMLRKSINSRLPDDISIDQIADCRETFDPREDVKWKRYSYTLKYRRRVIRKGELLPICSSGPNTVRCALDPSAVWVVPWALDDSKLEEFCHKLTGTHDYSVFVHKQARRDKSNVLTVNKLSCERISETNEAAPVVTVRFDVESKGFRRSMVRNLIGFLVDICHGVVDESVFQDLWSGDDELAAKLNMAPACVLGSITIASFGILKLVHDHLGGTEGFTRSLSFYSFAIPKYLEYRYHMYKKSPDDVWDNLDAETANVALDKAYELEGFYIKGGQMIAANMGGAFPQIWQDTMSVLQDQVPPQDFSSIKKIVCSELDFENVFSSFEEKPIGSAAIGQVHRATLRDGTPVVVKVRYPNVERILRGDVRTIKMFAQLAQPVHVPALEEIEEQFMTEFDYVQEGEQLANVRKNLRMAGLEGPGKLCRVPKPHLEYCTQRVLVMEELHGVKLADGLKEEMVVQAKREGKTTEQYLSEVKQKERDAKCRGEELKGPSSTEYDTYISILDKKRRIGNALRGLYNVSIGLLPGKKMKPIEDKSTLPVNHAKMIDDLLYIHGHEILVDGYFNGDCHPGEW